MNKKPVLLPAAVAMVATIALVCVRAHEDAKPGDQFRLRDFPPGPLELSAPTNAWPKPDPIIELAEHRVNLNVVSTNQAEMALTAEIKELKSKLLALEAAANAADPMLQVYDRYVEKAHEWVMANHSREFGIGYDYFTSGAAARPKRGNTDLVALIDMALYRDLATNTNFAPLLKGFFEVHRRKLHATVPSYTRNDAAIGFHPASDAQPATTFEEYVAELDKRYDLVLAKMDQIQRVEGIPTEAITGWMYGDLYRFLDGSAQDYVELNTPDELPKLRRQLQGKVIKLERLQKTQ